MKYSMELNPFDASSSSFSILTPSFNTCFFQDSMNSFINLSEPTLMNKELILFKSSTLYSLKKLVKSGWLRIFYYYYVINRSWIFFRRLSSVEISKHSCTSFCSYWIIFYAFKIYWERPILLSSLPGYKFIYSIFFE